MIYHLDKFFKLKTAPLPYHLIAVVVIFFASCKDKPEAVNTPVENFTAPNGMVWVGKKTFLTRCQKK